MSECSYKSTSAMTWKQFFLWISIFAVVQVGATFIVPRALPQAWEYRTFYMEAHSDGLLYGTDLEKFGKDGWDLVNMLPTGNRKVICTLKRPVLLLSSDEEEDEAEAEEKAREAERKRLAREKAEADLL